MATLSARVAFIFDLRWLSGELIGRFEVAPDGDVERFIQDMDEGLMESYGIPRSKTDESGGWLEMYELLWGNVKLECGQKFSDYAIPPDATLTVVLTSLT
jgi:hypothetical protein